MPKSQQNNKISIFGSKKLQFKGHVKKTRAPRLLWANSYCMLDTSSGASISIRQILFQLHKAGWEIEVVGATVFDDPKGTKGLDKSWDAIEQAGDVNVTVNDGPLTHLLVKTHSTVRRQMTVSEADRLYALYVDRLKKFRPDIVFFYGGTSTDFHISLEARILGIPSVAYLVNANYQSTRWCRDVDLILTDTQATANMYAEKQGFKPKPIGKFIDQAKVIAPAHTRQNATLINPSWAKGAGIVAMLAVLLENKRPDIKFEVVESRGSWSNIVRGVTRSVWGKERSELSNVIVTPHTDKVSEVYARSRIVLGLSQWWESGSRVLAEAMLNGIPAIVSNHGGSPEIVGDGGIVVDLPSACHEAPYNKMPKPEHLDVLVQFLERVWDDESFYFNLMLRALQQGNKLHRMEVSTQRLLEALKPFVELRAGDRDFSVLMEKIHKHKIKDYKFESAEETKNRPQDKPSVPGSLFNQDNATQSSHEVIEPIGPYLIENKKVRGHGRINLIHPGGNWILEKMAKVLEHGLENAQRYDYRELSLTRSKSPLNNPNAINYYIHYNLFSKKSAGIDVAWFTHIEEGIPSLKKKFLTVASAVDFAIFNSPKYRKISGLPDQKCSVIIPGIDEDFFSRKLILGIVGRDYEYTDRKNKSLVDLVRALPFVELRFTGGSLNQSDLPRFYRELDYVFTASTIEGGPMSLLEGLAAGKRSIFPRNVGLWSEYQKSVITYDHGDFDALEKLLRKLHAEKAALTSSVESCTWESFVQRHIDVFKSLHR